MHCTIFVDTIRASVHTGRTLGCAVFSLIPNETLMCADESKSWALVRLFNEGNFGLGTFVTPFRAELSNIL